VPSDAGASARVRQEHEEGLQAGAQVSFTCYTYLFATDASLPCPICWGHARSPVPSHLAPITKPLFHNPHSKPPFPVLYHTVNTNSLLAAFQRSNGY
jgi:hypothetical protein